MPTARQIGASVINARVDVDGSWGSRASIMPWKKRSQSCTGGEQDGEQNGRETGSHFSNSEAT
jgi:hypothetical protein